ncbi:leucine-rich repeat-containing protein 45-like [Trichogramma pretiosum]|uniref:leucine-rich repeat-containing protein 45-like n=1 Tax=Trichogramma pretiosum TaxID=7493 RepID=UPI0006C9B065|nr:leucine-rich repeat-containing protein 45-like [Trichogramma pretiosum]
MLDDADLFAQLCRKRGIIAEPDIVKAVKTSCTTGQLFLGNTSIIAGLCDIIAQVLTSSSNIKVLDLSDCMLLSKGLTSIFKALSQGSSVHSLFLKGNNISGHLVDQLGELFLSNNTLKIVHIEWNNLGGQVQSFSKFCTGLARNHHIEELDLRYNQISTLCADALAAAFITNKNLKRVDLSWNSLGMTGGQKILQGIKQNYNIVTLNVKGNCIPSDIHSAIKEQIMENQKRKILAEKPKSIFHIQDRVSVDSSEDDNQVMVSKKKHKKKKEKEKARTHLLEEHRGTPLGNSGNDDEENSKKSSNRSNTYVNEKIQTLNQMLLERSAAIDVLKTEIDTVNSELKIIETENRDLKSEIEKLKKENNNILEERSTEIENLKKYNLKEKENWKETFKELEEFNHNNIKLKQEAENKLRTYEKELRKSALELQSLKEKHSSTVQSLEDTISDCKTEVHRVKREAAEKETRYRIETNALKETLKETTDALEKCQEQLQKLRNDLRESHEIQTKLKIKTDDAERFAARTAKIEESLIKSKEERDKLEDKLQESRKLVATLQKQVIKLQEESIEPQKRYESLRLELQIEREKSENLKKDILEERSRLKEQNEQLQKMINQINNLYAQLSEAQKNHSEALRVKNGEIDKLKNTIAQKTRDLDEYKSEQVQRAHQFQAAISKYLGGFNESNAQIS